MNKYLKIFPLTLMLILFQYSLKCSAQDTLWTSHFGGPGHQSGADIQQTSDGGYIIAGSPYSLIKTNAHGDSTWSRSYAGPYASALCVRQTSDGGYIVFGGRQDNNLPPNVFIVRSDSIGDTLWTRIYGGAAGEYARSGFQTTDGGYIVAGFTESFGSGNGDVWLLKTNLYGDTLWTKTFGGSQADGAHSIESAIDGGYIIVGYSHSFGNGNYDIWILRTNEEGDTLWTKTYGGPYDDTGQDIRRTSDGGYIVIGNTTNASGQTQIIAIKLDQAGDTSWTRVYGSGQGNYGESVIECADGYLLQCISYSTGIGNGDILMIKINTSGDSLYALSYDGGGYDQATSIIETTDGNYAISGAITVSPGNSDIWILKFRESDLWNVSPNGDDRFGDGSEVNPFRTIQRAIMISTYGDTVLVHPGVYQENINFSGRSIVLGSQYLLTGDTSFVLSTIIDGSSSGSVVQIVGNTDSLTTIVGFTLRNGFNDIGGGILCRDGAKITIAHNKIIQNNAHINGGGISIINNPSIILGNSIIGNSIDDSLSPGFGGGIYCDSADIVIIGNLINNNFSQNGGGIYIDNSTYRIMENPIFDNRALSDGGGIGIENSIGQEILDNKIYRNIAYEKGGGLICWNSNPSILRNLINSNIAQNPDSSGGMGGGICLINSSPIINSNTIYGNIASYGGGIIGVQNSSPIITNDILWENSIPQIGYDSGFPLIRYCDIDGGYYGAGIIDCDPWFCFTPNNEFMLTNESCCRGKGCDAYGNPDSLINIGAFGVGCEANYIPGDINASRSFNGLDVTFSVNYFRGGDFPPFSFECTPGSTWHISGDVNNSCSFNGLDVTYMVNYFRGGAGPQSCAECPPSGFAPPATAVQPIKVPVQMPIPIDIND